MKHYKQLCIASILTLILAFSAFAGEMDTGRASQTDTDKAGEIQTTVTGQIDIMRTASTEIALNLLLDVLSLI